jgi:hypothetical protein
MKVFGSDIASAKKLILKLIKYKVNLNAKNNIKYTPIH